MEEFVSGETVKEKLIIAGLTELETHGAADFSLRRVASLCNVSCAAPYKHFKDKDDFIGEIINYVDNHWTALSTQVMSVFENDKKRLLLETCVAFVRFCTGNSHFRYVFMMNLGSEKTKLNMAKSITHIANDYFATLDEKTRDEKVFKINSMVLGAVTMSGDDTEANKKIIDMLKNNIEKEL